MAKYVNKEEVLSVCDAIWNDADETTQSGVDIINAMDKVTDFIESLPTEDLQPVNWIKVTDKLPETNEIGVAHILAYDRVEGVVKADFLDESANYIEGSNIFQISNTSTRLYKVTHWQPLPEPPKDDNYNDRKKAELVKFIQGALGYAYCDNCRGNDEKDFEGCEDCHRKYIGWEVSLPTATRIAEKAVQILSEEESDNQ